MSRKKESLFSGRQLFQYLLGLQDEARRIAETFDTIRLNEESIETIIQEIVSESFPDRVLFSTDKVEIVDEGETDVDVSGDPNYFTPFGRGKNLIRGRYIEIAVPYSGDSKLFKFQPSTITLGKVLYGEVIGNEIHLRYEFVKPEPQKIESRYKDDLRHLKNIEGSMNSDIDKLRLEVINLVNRVLIHKKSLSADSAKISEILNLPVRKRTNMPKELEVPLIRKKAKISKNVDSSGKEYSISVEVFEQILEIIQSLSLMMERSPSTFVKLEEEEIRDHILIHLNGHFEGAATGETFNYQGKTDILIRYENRNIFIAECKFWSGEKGLIDTIDQILRYTTWRDNRLCIILFNKNKGLSEVIRKAQEIVTSHSCFDKNLAFRSKVLSNLGSTFVYEFHHPSDLEKKLTLSLLVFDIPKG
ncbi:hypothetical protein LEP1GSC058_0204 [Leptospira fainei serovar Hurstbridge str. BUT 6]|uniref:Uncharacterized protein n=1 Tax=Leptospira fainei serovar Hurstbridge str. BUT 6 TaxID=1193011 RepID=S3UVN7_9LEPT|nr:hypothetical protein [Leptospira fainei]EPG72414.1 hypothetical protein LEP1GSC058_0204 [Leptospira fainei serovar Hurstbridge str. BUT 6]